MAKVTTSASRTIYIRSEYPVQGSMTAWALRDFVRALDEHGIPDNATLTAERDHNTMHFVAVSVRVSEPVKPEPTEPIRPGQPAA
ncbi:hypothetical protein [Micromonospora sp. DPT]|uniref:hypothetical protein n=1 Tax=Micromonospora sp. DPT TaxID=3142975 RepID=UPI00320A8385